jgi:sec-independent protein translocase protein TatB
VFGISGAEMIIILLVGLIVLGPDRLPEVARKAGQVLGEMRKVSAGFEAEMRTAMFEAERPTPHPQPDPDPVVPAIAEEQSFGEDGDEPPGQDFGDGRPGPTDHPPDESR